MTLCMEARVWTETSSLVWCWRAGQRMKKGGGHESALCVNIANCTWVFGRGDCGPLAALPPIYAANIQQYVL